MEEYKRNNKLLTVISYCMLFFAPMGAQAFVINVGIGRLSPLRSLTILSSLILLISLIRKNRSLRICNVRNKYSVLFFVFWALYSVVSVFWSKDLGRWFSNIYFILSGVLMIIVFNNVFDDKTYLEGGFYALNLGLFIQSVIGWYEIITRNYLFVNESRRYTFGVRNTLRIPIAMSGNPNDFAMMMLLGAILSYFCFVSAKKKIVRIFFLLNMISNIVLLLMTTSRGVILGLGASIAFVLFVGGKKKIAVLIMVGIILGLNTSIIDYIMGLFIRSTAEVNSDNSRLYLAYNGLYMVLDTFGVGVGCGQCYYWLENRAHFPVGSLRALHNWWIEILASFGIIIFISYLIFYLKMSGGFYKEYRAAVIPKDRALYLSITAFMVAFVIASISASSNFTNETLWVFWALCITLQGFNKLKTKEVAQ